MDSPARPAHRPRTGAPAGQRGHLHQAVFHSSDAELLAIVLPFLIEGEAAGEPTLVTLGDAHTALIRDALPPGVKVDFLPAEARYVRPASAIREYRSLLSGHVQAGATRIRLVGALPPALFGTSWDAWARYESAVNHAYDEFPVWSMCAYDRTRTPARVLDDVARTHPSAAGRVPVPHPSYLPPASFLAAVRSRAGDPLPAPHLELRAPSPAEARHAICTAGGALGPDALDDLSVSVSETVTNAHRHGTPPVTVRLWTLPDRLVVSVSDGGLGPADPFTGLLPAGDGARGGLGLWVTHQCCDHVTEHHGPNGYTVTMTMLTGR
ncbi:anti-sigma factor RsbA family regulatory protein [Catenuloplanes sp. NPDC051500]|uniref:anti-sigma factor RsbA family regulatory protein n=1 Tax=Catenuloplanes sp. NPDC051500 TaxID=3363959 RepID=UPI00378E5872